MDPGGFTFGLGPTAAGPGNAGVIKGVDWGEAVGWGFGCGVGCSLII